MKRSANPATFFSKGEEISIIEAVKTAEKSTAGEIRVHLERKISGDIMDFAVKIFNKIGMHNTRGRCGCLIILDLTNRRFAIIGDKGINDKVDADFWNDAADIMSRHFKQNDFAAGICAAILKIGEKLKEYFPYQPDDINELPDEISKSR